MLKTEVSGLHFGTNLGAKLASAGLRGPLGRQVGSRISPGRLPKRSRRPPGPKKNSLLSSGGPPEEFPSEISPSQGVPGTALGSILGGPGAHFGPPFGGRCSYVSNLTKNENKTYIFLFLARSFKVVFGTLFPALLRARRPRKH